MRPIFRHVIIITNTPDKYSYLKLPMYQDIIKGLGPLGGIFTGLQVIPNSGFFVACDMPFLNQGLIRHMVEIKADFDLVVPRISGYMEALHSLYGRGCERKIESLINSGIYQVFRFFNEVSARYVDEDEVRMFDPDLRSFLNINSPEALNDFDNLF
jgi:molybdopterin-guanine dinucleotide biosynthesis protein A